jgi:hypothetical protein
MKSLYNQASYANHLLGTIRLKDPSQLWTFVSKAISTHIYHNFGAVIYDIPLDVLESFAGAASHNMAGSAQQYYTWLTADSLGALRG